MCMMCGFTVETLSRGTASNPYDIVFVIIERKNQIEYNTIHKMLPPSTRQTGTLWAIRPYLEQPPHAGTS